MFSAAQLAVQAFIKYGKGRHPAGLNFGDCISYALAKTEVMPFLFKGDVFRLTCRGRAVRLEAFVMFGCIP
jgi:uncharacterized protein with PIN domain